MLASSMWAVDSYRRMTGNATGRVRRQRLRSGSKQHVPKGRRSGKQAGSGFMRRVEERWRRRQQGGR